MSQEPIDPEGSKLDNRDDNFPPDTSRMLSWSAIRFIRSPSSDFLMWSVVAIVIACIAIFTIAALVEMDVTVRGSGEIVSDFGSREALAPSSGQITAILKNTSDIVEENQVLALIKMDTTTKEKISDTLESLENMEKKVRFFQNSKVFDFTPDQISIPKLESSDALNALINLEQQIKYFVDMRTRSKKGLDNELRPLRQRAALLDSKIRKMKSSSERQLLGQVLEATEDEVGKIRSQISSSENEARLKIEQGMGELLKSIQSARSDLNSYLDQREIRSPIKGVVGDLNVKVNESVEANKSVARILPENSQLMVAIHIYSKDIVKVSAGKSTLFKVEAYPYQTYGSFTGKVISFEQAKGNDAALGDYVVYSTIELPPQLSNELKSKMKLIVGMKLYADIISERKSGLSILNKMVFEKN